MTQKLTIIFKSFLVFTLFAVSLSALAQWQPPSANPPDGNGPTALNAGILTQVKNGSLVMEGGKATVMIATSKLGVGNNSLPSLFTVGNGDKFQIDTNGNIIKLNNITYSWPSAQGVAGTVLTNNGSGTLTWEAGGGGGGGTWGSITGVLADQTDLDDALNLKAPKASPAFTGNPTAPTATAGDNDTSIATTAFVTEAVASGGSGEANTASNLGGGLANFDSKSGVDLRFNSFKATDFDLTTNLLSIDYLNGQTASASTKGFLSSANWTTFNNKMTNPMTTLGDIIYGGTSGTPTRLGAGTSGYILTSNGAGVAPSWQASTAGGWTRTGTNVHLTNSGDNVGIGTDTPAKKLDVAADVLINGHTLGRGAGNVSSNTAFGFETMTSTGGTTSNNTAMGWRAMRYNTGSENTAVGTYAVGGAGSSSYNVGIGNQALQSASSTSAYNVAIGYAAFNTVMSGGSNTALGSLTGLASGVQNGTAIGAGAYVSASHKVRIGNANVTKIEGQVAWSTPSDIRLKKDISDTDLGLNFINSLRPVSYKLINGDDNLNYGFIAQEVEVALEGRQTNIVATDADAMHTKTMRYTDLIAPLVKAVQELKSENDKLKERIEVLEAKLK